MLPDNTFDNISNLLELYKLSTGVFLNGIFQNEKSREGRAPPGGEVTFSQKKKAKRKKQLLKTSF